MGTSGRPITIGQCVFVSRAFQLNHWFMSWEVFAHPGGLKLYASTLCIEDRISVMGSMMIGCL